MFSLATQTGGGLHLRMTPTPSLTIINSEPVVLDYSALRGRVISRLKMTVDGT